MSTEFADELRTWLRANAPESLYGRGPLKLGEGPWGGKAWDWDSDPDTKVWLDRMAARGRTAPTWPKAFGGGGLTKKEAKILQRTLAEMKLPAPLIGFGLTMIGPTLLQYGNDAQRKLHLGRIIRGEVRWCQGYSEPGAGSDLASLQTRAERDGDHFVVNGQKIWTSYADAADWIFCLVRTTSGAKKQHGITFLLIDMDDPGITTRPIQLISGASPFCEVFFENVRVPVANVIHEIDAGWQVAKALLGHERTMIGEVFGAQLSGREEGGGIRQRAKDAVGTEDDGRLADPVLRDKLARLRLDFEGFALVMKRVSDAMKSGQKPGPESSILKIHGTELNQRRKSLEVEIAGPNGIGWQGPGFTDRELTATREWLRSRANTIEGGTSEIQLNIIAKRVLGLPSD